MTFEKKILENQKKLSICIVNTHFFDKVGGSQLQCDIIAEELQKRGHNVTYIAIDGNPRSYNKNYGVVPVERDGNQIGQKISEIKPDVLYWRFNKKFFLKSVKKAAKYVGKIVFAVSNIKDLQPYSASLKKPLRLNTVKEFIQKNLVSRYNHTGFNYVDALTVNNENQLYLSPITPCIYVPNAIYTEFDNFSWPRPFILWVANIKHRKQPEIFINAAQKLSNREIDFIMIGKIEDSSYDWIERNSRVPNNFHYLGPKQIQTVNAALKQSLFLSTTSKPEGFSNNIIQAWYQQKPVVAFEFDPGGLIQKHELGMVSKGDIDLYLKHLDEMITNKKLRDKLGKEAYQFANSHFSKRKTVDLLEDLFLEISVEKE